MFTKRLWAALLLLGTFSLPVYGQGRSPKVVGEYTLETRQHVHSVAISPDGKTLAAGNDNIHLYDLTSDEPKATKIINSRIAFGVKALVFSADSKYIACGGSDNKVTIWSVSDEPMKVAEGKSHAGDIRALAFSKDGKHLLSGSDDKTMILWNFSDGKLTENSVIRSDDKTSSSVRAVGFMGNNVNNIVSANTGGALRIWQLQKSGKYTPLNTDKIPSSSDPNIALRPVGKGIAVSTGNDIQAVIGTAPGLYKDHTKRVSGVTFSPDGLLLASCGYDGRIHVWLAGSPRPLIAKERPDNLTCISFTPPPMEGSHTIVHLAAGTDKGKVFVMKLEPTAPKKK